MNLSQDSRPPGRDLNLGPPENEIGVLATGRQFCKSCNFMYDLKKTRQNKILSGHQPRQVVKRNQRFGTHLRPHHQESDP
jgi:hypothetical protein